MKKIVLLLLISAFTYTGYAQNAGTLTGMTVADFVETLSSVEGYFFIGKGEERDLSLTLGREPANDLNENQAKEMDWTSFNEAIVTVDDYGYAHGVAYGEALISTHDGDKQTNYVVFVCPKVSIVSPEGAIYSYHKIYNQQSRVQFTESKDWKINAITRDGVLIPDNSEKDGWYESDEAITSDVCFHVTMEHADNYPFENVKITVNGHKVTIADPVGYAGYMNNRPVSVKDMWGDELYGGTWPSEGTLKFKQGNEGIFFISIPNDQGGENQYKIIIEDKEDIDE